MEKIVVRQVREQTAHIINILHEDNFFTNLDVPVSVQYAEKYLNEIFTDKFIAGKPLDLGDDEEISQHLDRIIDGSLVYDLKEKGFVDSYEDEQTPEVFFMTEKGRMLQKTLLGK